MKPHGSWTWKDDLGQLTKGLPILIALVAAAIPAYQIYHWLRYSEWVPISVVTFLQWNDVQWAAYPHDWAGLHSLLSSIPLFFVVLVAGGFLVAVLWGLTAVDR